MGFGWWRWWQNSVRAARWWGCLGLFISLIPVITLLKFLLLILSLLLLLRRQDALSNDNPITVPIPFISYGSASDRRKSEKGLLVVRVLNRATSSA